MKCFSFHWIRGNCSYFIRRWKEDFLSKIHPFLWKDINHTTGSKEKVSNQEKERNFAREEIHHPVSQQMPTKIHLEMQVLPGREWKCVLRRLRWNFFWVIPDSSVLRSKGYLKKSLSSIWSQGMRLLIFTDLATDWNCIDSLNLQLLCMLPYILFVLPELLREDSHWILMQDIFRPMGILCVCFSKLYLPLMIKIALTLEFRANNHHLWWSSCGSESCYAVCFIFTHSLHSVLMFHAWNA